MSGRHRRGGPENGFHLIPLAPRRKLAENGCRASGQGLSTRKISGRGGIGRRAGLKIRFRKECRFDPDRPHQPPLGNRRANATAQARPQLAVLRGRRQPWVRGRVDIAPGMSTSTLVLVPATPAIARREGDRAYDRLKEARERGPRATPAAASAAGGVD